MLQSLSFENIRGQSRNIEFKMQGTNRQRIHIKGANGVGKSSVADAITFAFTGMDSQGNPLPIHLISEGQDKLKVQINTGKAIIERSLTRKKSQSIKLVRPDTPPMSVTQEDLTKMTCSRDAFLSAFMAGYFMSLPFERAMQVLSEAVPPVDKMGVLEGIMGKPINDGLKPFVDLSKPADLAASKLVVTRRSLQKSMAEKEGQIKSYSEAQDPGEAPATPAGDVPERLQMIRGMWDKHDMAMANYNEAISKRNLVLASNKVLEHQRKSAEDELESIPADVEVPDNSAEISNNTAKIQELYASLKPLPEAPAAFTLPSQSRCPSCGQTVGSKHRTSVEEKNQQALSQYESDLKDVSEYNSAIKDEIAALTERNECLSHSHATALETNRRLVSQRKTVEVRLAGFVLVGVPAEPEMPKEPDFPRPTKEDIERTVSVWRKYYEQSTLHMAAKKNFVEANQKISAIRNEMVVMECQVKEIEEIEEALTKLDGEVFKISSGYYKLDKDRRIVSDMNRVSVVDDSTGMQYHQFSTGERIFADVKICEKLNSLLKKTARMIFVDNFDLVNPRPELIDVDTLITVTVTDTDFEITSRMFNM